MSRQRQEQLKKILASIAQPGANVDKAAQQLDKMFDKAASEAGKSADQIISDSGRRGDTGAIEVPIDVQFKPIFGNLKAATGNASRLLTSFFSTYEDDLTKSLRTTETFIPQFNKLFLSLGNQRLAGFDQFKGLSSQYATDTK
jgi:ABC-type transporter Mla subunit MlaD